MHDIISSILSTGVYTEVVNSSLKTETWSWLVTSYKSL